MLTAGEKKIGLGMQSVGFCLHSQQASSHKNILMIVASLIQLIRNTFVVETNSNTNAQVFLEGGFSFAKHCGGCCSEFLMRNVCAHVNIC